MSAYLVRFYDSADRLRRSHRMECQDDDDAIHRAVSLGHKFRLEVWEAERLVWRLDPSLR